MYASAFLVHRACSVVDTEEFTGESLVHVQLISLFRGFQNHGDGQPGALPFRERGGHLGDANTFPFADDLHDGGRSVNSIVEDGDGVHAGALLDQEERLTEVALVRVLATVAHKVVHKGLEDGVVAEHVPVGELFAGHFRDGVGGGFGESVVAAVGPDSGPRAGGRLRNDGGLLRGAVTVVAGRRDERGFYWPGSSIAFVVRGFKGGGGRRTGFRG